MTPKTSAAWASAMTLAQLCDVNIRFILGEIDESPTHGAIHAETNEIADDLIELNRRGFLTTCSQPAAHDGALLQRSFVVGFTSRETALRLAEKELYSDLLIRFFPPGPACSCPMIPVTQNDGRPFTWAGGAAWEDLEHFGAICGASAMDELSETWAVVAIDLTWGRKEYLWKTLCEAPRAGFSVKPHPDLGLGDQEY